MAYKFRNLTTETVWILGAWDGDTHKRAHVELAPERRWGGEPPYPPKVMFNETLQIHHPASLVNVDVRIRSASVVENLPDAQPFTFVIVERDVAEAVPGRADLVYVSRKRDQWVEEFATISYGAGRA